MEEVRILQPGDEALLLRFLDTLPDTTMFLRSNVAAAGLEDRGERLQGTYAAALRDGAVVAVACHVWHGALLYAAPTALEQVTDAAVRASGRAVTGLIGRCAEVDAARRHLGLLDAPTVMDSREVLFGLDLAALRLPAALVEGRVTVRRATVADLEDLLPWGRAYAVETLGEEDGPAVGRRVHESLAAGIAERTVWIAHEGGRRVAMTRFNATTPDCVQVGGVYTPPALRARGHARAAVAGSLRDARAEGAVRSILFTDEGNRPAQACYAGLGYAPVGDYAIVLLRAPGGPAA